MVRGLLIGDPMKLHTSPLTLCLGLCVLAFGCDGTPGTPPGEDAGPPSGSDAGSVPPGTDAGPPSMGTDAGLPAPGTDAGPPPPGVDAGPPLPPSGSFRGIPARPLADVVLPATGTVPVGAATCIGSPGAPAFLIGDGTEYTPPGGIWDLEARDCIIANVNVRGRLRLSNSSMAEIRSSEIHHGTRGAVILGGTDLAVVDSHIHHARGNNGHGVQPRCGSARIWVENNLLEYNDEDGFQSGHRCTGNEPDELYFYGNTCNNNRENCFDVKWTNRAVVSGNLMYRHRNAQSGVNFVYDDGSEDGEVNSGSDGMAVVIGSDGTPTTTFLFDNVYRDNMGCVRVEDAVDVWASGEDCRDALPAAQVGGYQFDKSGHTRIVDSIFTDVPYMFTDRWRSVPVIEEANNTMVGTTQFRRGMNATLTSGGVSDADVEAAYRAVFGRAP